MTSVTEEEVQLLSRHIRMGFLEEVTLQLLQDELKVCSISLWALCGPLQSAGADRSFATYFVIPCPILN